MDEHGRWITSTRGFWFKRLSWPRNADSEITDSDWLADSGVTVSLWLWLYQSVSDCDSPDSVHLFTMQSPGHCQCESVPSVSLRKMAKLHSQMQSTATAKRSCQTDFKFNTNSITHHQSSSWSIISMSLMCQSTQLPNHQGRDHVVWSTHAPGLSQVISLLNCNVLTCSSWSSLHFHFINFKFITCIILTSFIFIVFVFTLTLVLTWNTCTSSPKAPKDKVELEGGTKSYYKIKIWLV